VAPFFAIVIGACGGTAQEAASPATSSALVHDQASVGAKLYGDHCATCHGADGKGSSKIPPLVGNKALPLDPSPQAQDRKGQFRTAADVFAFIKASMPPDAPGSLSDDDYWAILAFDLRANGVDSEGKKVDGSTAGSFTLHR
jgi:cytochrome c